MTKEAGRARFRGQPVDVAIDVRSKIEFWLGHLPGAVCIPVDTIPDGLASRGITPDQRILLYCASGNRSATAKRTLVAAGYQHVVDAGGYSSAAEHYIPAGGK